MNNHIISSTILLFDEQAYCFINSHIVWWIVIVFIIIFQVYKSMLLYKKKITKIHVLFLVLSFLFFKRFRGFSCILKVLFLCGTNKYLKDNVFTHLSQLHICFILNFPNTFCISILFPADKIEWFSPIYYHLWMNPSPAMTR